jgi:hypothetical protein
VSTQHDATRNIFSPSVGTAWTSSGENPQIWQTSTIGTAPTKDSNSLDPSIICYDEWQAIDYRAIASPAGALAVLGGDHLFESRKWQVWQSSNNPLIDSTSWEVPYRTDRSTLLMKAVSDEGIAVGERIEGHSTYWGKVDSVVIEKGVETILPESSGAFAMGASICRINAGEPGSKSRLAVGGSSLWVQQDNDWHQAEHPPTMSTIIAIAKDGVMLGSTTIWRNGTSIPLDELVKNHTISDTNPAPRFTNLRAYAMNGEGAIVAMADDEATKNTTAKGKVLLMLAPVEMIPDWNRDGRINEDDRGKVSEENPWRFWRNSDDDWGVEGGEDTPGADESDYLGNKVDGVRDLVDFFPVHFDLKSLLQFMPETEYQYILKHESQSSCIAGAGYVPSFNVLWYPEADIDSSPEGDKGVGSYLKNIARAEEIANRTTNIITKVGLRLPREILLASKEGKGVALFESRYTTDNPIMIEIRKNDGSPIAKFSMPTSISEVESMYRYKFVMPDEVEMSKNDLPQDPPNWPDADRNGKHFIFVHGYNVNDKQSIGWASETFKRLFWSGSNARFSAFAWRGYQGQTIPLPIAGRITPDYQTNLANAFGTAKSFKQYLDLIDGEKTVAAHSMGNILVSSAMHDWGARPKNYLMLNAAVAKECYDSDEADDPIQDAAMENMIWRGYPKILRASEWHRLLPKVAWPACDSRANLTWRGRFAKVIENGGFTDVYNFFSSGEEVLNNPKLNTPETNNVIAEMWHTSNRVWAVQEKRKGHGITGFIHTSNHGGWSFNLRSFYDAKIHDDSSKSILMKRPDQLDKPLTKSFLMHLASNPFFDRSKHSKLYDLQTGEDAPGSDYAQKHRNEIISEMIPCTSFATGRNSFISEKKLLPERNIDMNLNMKTDPSKWPLSNAHSPDDLLPRPWLHSDIKAKAFVHNWLAYEKFIDIGKLK